MCKGDVAHKLCGIDKQDAGVGFEVDPLCLLDKLKTFDSDICLVGKPEPYQLQHVGASLEGMKDSKKSAEGHPRIWWG